MLRLGIDESDIISNGELFAYYAQPTVSSIFPSYGFLEGGDEVLVSGTYFMNTTTLNCYFGDIPSPQIEWISDTSILCISPLIEHKEVPSRVTVTVTVTNNGVDFTHAGTLTEYEYMHRPDAISVWPSSMNDVNRTSIVIKGKGLSRVEACLFGNVKHRHQAFNVTGNSMSLPCPVSHYCRKGVKTPRHVKGDYSTPQICLQGHFCPRGSISPEGSGPCPAGHYCPDNFMSLSSVVIPLAIPCDVGHYCPGTGNTNPKECFPGSYSPMTGRSVCILCEVGRQCPEWGMSEPELCAAGFVCDIDIAWSIVH